MNGNFFQYKNRIFMKVMPRPCLMKSGLIADVVDKGNHLAVDMNTGNLTIVPKKYFEEPVRVYFKYINSDGYIRDIPRDPKVAALKIYDHLMMDPLDSKNHVVKRFENDVDDNWIHVTFHQIKLDGLKGLEKRLEQFMR